MRTTTAAIAAVSAMLAVSPAAADPAPGCARFRNVTHDWAIKTLGMGEEFLKLVQKESADVAQQRVDLDSLSSEVSTVNDVASAARCSLGCLVAR